MTSKLKLATVKSPKPPIKNWNVQCVIFPSCLSPFRSGKESHSRQRVRERVFLLVKHLERLGSRGQMLALVW